MRILDRAAQLKIFVMDTENKDGMKQAYRKDEK